MSVPQSRDAGDERLRAVDGIEHPHELGVGAVAAEFLANDTVRGELRLDQFPHQLLGAAVSEGHGSGVTLRLDDKVRTAEIRPDEVAALAGELGEEGAIGRQIHDIFETTKAPERHRKMRPSGLNYKFARSNHR